jgi:hypothetical protein
MDATGNVIGINAHFFHDVDLSTSRPTTSFDWHHPPSGPGSFAFWQFDASLDIAVLEAYMTVPIETTAEDLIVFLESINPECALLALCHLSAFRTLTFHVGLQLVVDPTGSRFLIDPEAGVEFRFGELVVPDQLVAWKRTRFYLLALSRKCKRAKHE